MHFINPIELLNLSGDNIESIDKLRLKKARRNLIADIELSDDQHYYYNGIQLTKADCEGIIELLDTSKNLKFYYYLTQNKALNNFLATGSMEFFKDFKHESIYKDQEFLDFINPYYAKRFSKALLEAIKSTDANELREILHTKFLVSKHSTTIAYSDPRKEIESRIDYVKQLTEKIRNEDSEYTEESIPKIINLVEKLFPVSILNEMPNYFQSQINSVADSINFLGLAIWNNFNNTYVPLKLLAHILLLDFESASKPTFEKNYSIIKIKHEERIEQEQNAPTLRYWAKILIDLNKISDDFEEENLTPPEVLQKVINALDISTLNTLPSYANDIRNQIAYSVRALSISSWNEKNNMRVAKSLISIALDIETEEDVRVQFLQDHEDLDKLSEKYKGMLVCFFCGRNDTDEGCEIETTIYKVQKRSYFPRSVHYSSAIVKIPRCDSCRKIHQKALPKRLGLLFLFLITGGIIGIMTGGELVLILVIIGAVAGWIAGKIAESNIYKKANIRNQSTSTLRRHPLLRSRIIEGWEFSKPRA